MLKQFPPPNASLLPLGVIMPLPRFSWCYECDSYIVHPSLTPLLVALEAAKFNSPPTLELSTAAPEAAASEGRTVKGETAQSEGRKGGGGGGSGSSGSAASAPAAMAEWSAKEFGEALAAKKFRHILVLAGAGMSTGSKAAAR